MQQNILSAVPVEQLPCLLGSESKIKPSTAIYFRRSDSHMPEQRKRPRSQNYNYAEIDFPVQTKPLEF